MKKFYLNILNKEQGRVFSNLDFLTKKGFYLAGGTGLALQLGHRTSVDFDKSDASFFYYEYPLVKKLVKIKGVAVASVEDIAAMKMIAISHRPVKRDYVDVFFLLKFFSLEEIFSFVKKRYPNFNQYFSLRALSYFDDIEEKRGRKVMILKKSFSWEKAKKEIFAKARKYQLEMLKK